MTRGAWPNGDPNTVIREILAQPEYRHTTATSGHDYSPLFALLQRIIDFFMHLLQPVFSGSHTRGLGILVVVVVYALVLGAVIYLVLALVEALVGWSPIRGRSGIGVTQALETTAPQALRRQAAAAYARGEFGRAIALLFRAALFALDRAAIVAFDASRTPGEYRRVVRRTLPAQAPPFDDLSQRFVQASFGAAASRPQDYDAAEAAYAEFAPNDFLPLAERPE
jgi:Domain of unknown function (DUF4129)